jgi:GDP/UDP-N,N'-diacetylbacillosamine 2-epimerase (hydrolysing)
MSIKHKKICFIGTSRATYGYKKNIIKILNKRKNIKVYYLVTGTHVIKKYGYSIKEIIKDKIPIYKKFKIFKHNEDSLSSFTLSLSNEMKILSRIFKKIKPDILVVTGDRAEMFVAAITGVYMRIPVAHIQSGDLSGHIDGSVRHAITKISHLHFASCENSRRRVVKMGEEEWRVFNVGAPQLDDMEKIKDYSVFKKIKLDINEKFFLIIFHPVIYELEDVYKQLKIVLDSVNEYNLKKIIIYPNIDTGNSKIINLLKKLKKNKDYRVIKNLERFDYLALLKKATILLGNSSSGILESPTYKIPTINLGERQRGRVQAINIINSGFNKNKIKKKINYIINNKKYARKLSKCNNPYQINNSSKKIANIITKIIFRKNNKKLLDKKMSY